MDKHSALQGDPEGSNSTRRARARPLVIDYTYSFKDDDGYSEFKTPSNAQAAIALAIIGCMSEEALAIRSLSFYVLEDGSSVARVAIECLTRHNNMRISESGINIMGEIGSANFELSDPDCIQLAADFISDGLICVSEKQRTKTDSQSRWISEMGKYSE